jgi:predicted ATPase
VSCRGYVRPLWLLGYPDRAVRSSQEAVALALELAHPFSLAFALNWAATVHQFRREAQATQEQAEALIALATEHGFGLWVPFATVLRGWALAEQGHSEEGIAGMRQGAEGWRATGAEVDRPYFLALLAEAYGQAGEVETALDLLAQGLALAQKYDEVYWEPELHRLRGELLLTQAAGKGTALAAATRPSTLAEAETLFRQAIDVARRHDAKSLELRAVVSLSRLWQRQGRREEARQRLAEIYGWFTEGFDTPDLQEAGAMLTELS